MDELLSVQNESYDRPTILVVRSVKGEEEIPDGAVAVLTPDMPDVLSHVSVRARNCKVITYCILCFECPRFIVHCGGICFLQVCFATCFDPNILSDLQANEGKLLRLKPTSADIVYRYFYLFPVLKDCSSIWVCKILHIQDLSLSTKVCIE